MLPPIRIKIHLQRMFCTVFMCIHPIWSLCVCRGAGVCVEGGNVHHTKCNRIYGSLLLAQLCLLCCVVTPCTGITLYKHH